MTQKTEIVPPQPNHSLEVYKAIASVIAASAAVLATRLILLLSLVGAFVLALIAMQSSSWLTLAVLCAYSVLVVLPMVALEIRTRWTAG